MGAAAQQGRLSAAPELAARRYAGTLLHALGRSAARLDLVDEHPALAWAASGLMALTGRRDGAPQVCPAPLAACADGALTALAALAPALAFAGLRGSRLLAERAAITGFTRNGAIAPGGSCRLLEAADGAIALNLARPDDWTLLAAWLERDSITDWDAVAGALRDQAVGALVERGREVGLAVALDAMPEAGATAWFSRNTVAAMGRSHNEAPRVIDLSSLWAGPLCGQLLSRAGAEVIKVESTRRPDGARQGPRAFFDLLNAGKASVALDFATADGRARLRALLESADIVIEGSRPRALRQLGIDAQALVRANPGLTWLSITGYGRAPAREQWIAYGDDAGVAAGLSTAQRAASGERLVVGDAIADPLTGLHAALAAWSAWQSGGGLVEVSLTGVVAHCLAFDAPAQGWAARAREWEAVLARSGMAPAMPRSRALSGLARPLGADAGILETT